MFHARTGLLMVHARTCCMCFLAILLLPFHDVPLRTSLVRLRGVRAFPSGLLSARVAVGDRVTMLILSCRCSKMLPILDNVVHYIQCCRCWKFLSMPLAVEVWRRLMFTELAGCVSAWWRGAVQPFALGRFLVVTFSVADVFAFALLCHQFVFRRRILLAYADCFDWQSSLIERLND